MRKNNEAALVSFQKDDRVSAYSPVVGTFDGTVTCGWIAIENGIETLKIKNMSNGQMDEIYSGRYIQCPLICNDQILFSADIESGDWPLFAARRNDSGRIEIEKISRLKGRIASLRGEIRTDAMTSSWVAYECRQGKDTRVYAAYFKDDQWVTDIPLSDPATHAYDPHAARAQDGMVYVVYSAFVCGNYHILLQKLNDSGDRVGPPVRISDQSGVSYWPSISSRQEGGVWICWTSLTRNANFERSYLQHDQYRDRQNVFTHLPVMYAGIYDHDQLVMPVTNGSAYARGGNVEAFAVEHSVGAKRGTIVPLDDGTVNIFYRKYDHDQRRNEKPDIAVTSLSPTGWTEPQSIVEHGWHEENVNLTASGNTIQVACMIDHRRFPEWFDATGTIVLSLVELQSMPAGNGEVPLIPYTVSPVPIPSIEEQPHQETERATGARLIWGQTHCHSSISICQRIFDQDIHVNYRFFQDVQQSGFGGITDHCYNHGPLEAHIIQKMADFYYFPGEFIAFAAYEWTGSGAQCTHENGPFGHVNCLFLDDHERINVLTPKDKHSDGSSLNKLWKTYAGKKIITIPHHTADRMHPYNWDFYRERMVPVVEIFQDYRGQHEQPGAYGSTPFLKTDHANAWVVEALNRGYRLGFIGGGDHAGQARGGAEVTALTREALYEAFQHRRTYASSGAGADISFTCNNEPVGSVIQAELADFSLQVHTNEEIESVQIVKCGETVHQASVKDRSFQYRWNSARDQESEFWYCRILLANGEAFWTSPIWLEASAQ